MMALFKLIITYCLSIRETPVFRQRCPHGCLLNFNLVVFPSEVEAIVPDRDREVVLNGSSRASHDSVTAAEKLVRLGYSKVLALAGGLAAWREAGYPLTGNDPD